MRFTNITTGWVGERIYIYQHYTDWVVERKICEQPYSNSFEMSEAFFLGVQVFIGSTKLGGSHYLLLSGFPLQRKVSSSTGGGVWFFLVEKGFQRVTGITLVFPCRERFPGYVYMYIQRDGFFLTEVFHSYASAFLLYVYVSC